MDLLLEFLKAVFLFGLVLVLTWAATRFVGARMTAPVRGRSLRVLEHIATGRDRSVMLLEAGGRIYLIGATAQQITLLDAISDPEVIARIIQNVPQEASNPLGVDIPKSFREILAKVRGAAPVSPPPAPPESPVSDDELERLEGQIERLRRLQTNKK